MLPISPEGQIFSSIAGIYGYSQHHRIKCISTGLAKLKEHNLLKQTAHKLSSKADTNDAFKKQWYTQHNKRDNQNHMQLTRSIIHDIFHTTTDLSVIKDVNQKVTSKNMHKSTLNRNHNPLSTADSHVLCLKEK